MKHEILKQNWERRTASVKLNPDEVQKAISNYSSHKILSYELLSTGCANSNYKVTFFNGEHVILRIYTRDPKSLEREDRIHQLVQDIVPVPRFRHINLDESILSYPFAVLEYVEGQLFRDLIFEGNNKAIQQCAYDAGRILTEIASFQFDKPGFFEPDLSVKPFEKDQTFYDITLDFLRDERVIKCLGKKLVADLSTLATDHKDVLINLSTQRSLTHADYDPSNMLVRKEGGRWQVVAILDWEFAFSSSPSIDVGLMLRYAPQLPHLYQQSFIRGIHETNPSFLQADWELRAKLVDMISLLSLLASDDAEKRPVMLDDVKGLLSLLA